MDLMLVVERSTFIPFAHDVVAQALARAVFARRLTPDWARVHPDGYDLGGIILSWQTPPNTASPITPATNILTAMQFSGWINNASVECDIYTNTSTPTPSATPVPNQSSCTLTTRIRFDISPEARVKRLGGSLADVASESLANLIDFQHQRLIGDLTRLAPLAALALRTNRPLRIAISGASGLIGRALFELLAVGGHDVIRLVRTHTVAPDEAFWQLPIADSAGSIDSKKLEGLDALVHLAGESIASGRWTRRKRERIRASRVEGTRLIARALAALDVRPSCMVMASGIHYYGDRGSEELTEASSLGSGFLAEVSREWEAAADPARAANIRVAALRIGQVLSMRGGALPIFERPFRLGLGPVFASGSQYWSWITLDDVLSVITLAIATPDIQGPINTTAPVPATMGEFAQTLARILERPLFAKVPAWALRTLLGDMSEAVLTSTRAVPDRLRASTMSFQFPRIEAALRWELGKPLRER